MEIYSPHPDFSLVFLDNLGLGNVVIFHDPPVVGGYLPKVNLGTFYLKFFNDWSQVSGMGVGERKRMV
jgi:hypothetical protein